LCSTVKVHPRTDHESPNEGVGLPDGGGWLSPHLSYAAPGKETWYTLYRRVDGP